MPANPNLIPTVVTDKNGRVTTVHKKNSPTSVTTAIPAPTSSNASRVRTSEELIGSIAKMLRATPPPEGYIRSIFRDSDFAPLHRVSDDLPYLEKVHELIEKMTGNEKHYRTLMEILNGPRFDDKESMLVLHAYRDVITDDKCHVNTVWRFHNKFTSRYGIAVNAEGRIEAMKAHIAADRHYDEHYDLGYGTHRKLRNYEDNEIYVTAVDRYADNLDALMAYREEYGINIDPDTELDDFSAERFEEYLNHGALGNGSL